MSTIIFAGAGLALLSVIAIAVVLYGLPALNLGGGGGSYTRLDDTSLTLSHRDGLLVAFQAAGEPIGVRLDSQPREQFVSGQAGAAWTDALAQLPAGLRLLSPIYTIQTREDPSGQLYAEMSIPNGAEPLETLSLYAWDEEVGAWAFMPSQQDVVRDVIGFTPIARVTHVAAMQKDPVQPIVALVLNENTVLDAAVAQSLQVAIPTGVNIMADGNLSGQPVAVSETAASRVMPLVTNAEGAAAPGLIFSDDTALNDNALNSLAELASDYDGLTLDLEVTPEGSGAYGVFVSAVADRLHSSNKTLSVVVRGTTLTAYDLDVLDKSVDQFWWAPGDDPTLYVEGGVVQNVLYALTGELDRRKFGLLVSSDTFDVSSGATNPLTTEESLTIFGDVAPIQGYLAEGDSTTPGEQIPFRLTGGIQAMAYDPTLGANYVSYQAEDGTTHYVYYSSAEALVRKLNWAERYGLNGVAVESSDDAIAADSATAGLSAFIAQTPAAPPPPLSIVWQVLGTEGTTLNETAGDLAAIQYLWVAEEELGDYVISAAVGGQATSSRGEYHVSVVEATAESAPDAQPAEVVQADTPTDTSGEPAADVPPPAIAAGSAAGGGFELGGQVRGGEFYGFMQQAGMTWVKYQVRGLGSDASGEIASAHSSGFKVLLSVLGGHNIDFDAWANYFGQLAAQGPDAIEIWNEPNFSREWPEQHMGGDKYVNLMLAPAYNAIKAANPNVMVISGAPTPTGAFQGCSHQDWLSMTGCDDNVWINQVAAAGGANYMDCVGVHYNAGATSPNANSGHPAGGHYSWYYGGMVNTYSAIGRPLCFTEFGYAVGPGLPQNFAWANDNTLEEQATWLAEAATLSSQRNVRLMIVWNVGGFGGAGGGDPQGAYAIVQGGTGCPACATLGQVMGVQ